MNPHERQQFDMLLEMAVDRYAERLTQRNDGAESARQRLLDTPEADGVWLSDFVDAVFGDALIDNTAGACFVLEALARRPPPEVPPGRTIAETLDRQARHAFASLLRSKTLEELARRAGYQAVQP